MIPGHLPENAATQLWLLPPQVLEWCGVLLTGRSFEEVVSVMQDYPALDDPVDLLLEDSSDL